MDLTLKTREGYFNYRVAGVIIKDDKNLRKGIRKQMNIICRAVELCLVKRVKKHSCVK